MSAWLKCRIEKGMFSDEVTVVVRSRSAGDVAVFVPKETTNPAGRVKVQVPKTSGQGPVIAILPDAAQSVVDVDFAELLATP